MKSNTAKPKKKVVAPHIYSVSTDETVSEIKRKAHESSIKTRNAYVRTFDAIWKGHTSVYYRPY